MRRLAGLDINGWRDWAVRNYTPEEPDEPLRDGVAIDGGLASRVVRDIAGLPIAGPQAILAPHGRGTGWGKVGDPVERGRRSVRDLMRTATSPPDGRRADPELAAIDRALAPRARQIVFTVPDATDMDPRAQQALIDRLAGRGRPATLLLWRPVAALLHAIRERRVTAEAAGREIGILLHDDEGFACQRLRLRALPDHGGTLAPERAGYGTRVRSPCGLDALHRRLADEVTLQNPVLRDDPQIDESRLAYEWLLADAAGGTRDEILRCGNGSWQRIAVTGDAAACLGSFEIPTEVVRDLHGAARVFVWTPLAPSLADRLLHEVDRAVGAPVERLASHAVADGALEAARRIARGVPHYLDRLDPIAMAMLDGRAAVFRDLFDEGAAVVPANREYVSRPQKAIWSTRLTRLEFFIRRGDEGVRKWITDERTPPETSQTVDIRVRQTPAQGLARVEIVSDGWEALRRDPIRLDWDTLEVETRSEAEILERLTRPLPGKPDRLVYPADAQLWEGGAVVGEGLLAAMRGFDPRDLDAQTRLYKALARSFNPLGAATKSFAISTDGEPPGGITLDTVARLDAHLAALADVLVGEARRGIAPPTRHGLLATTWVFTRAPPSIKEELLRVLEDDRHPWGAASWRKSVLHSVGRTVDDRSMIARAFAATAAMPQNIDVRACQSFLLARRPNAPKALDGATVRTLTQNANDALTRQLHTRNFASDFNYTLYLLIGMLRYREVEPDALLADRSMAAKRIEKTLVDILPRITGAPKKVAVVEELLNYLRGEEGDPRLLVAIDEIAGSNG